MTDKTKTLAGKTALVTGGSRGIGAATARALAAAGANVGITYTNSQDKAAALVRELEGRGVRAAAFRGDQADAAQSAEVVRKAKEYFGRLDILVNNAGVSLLADFTKTADSQAVDRHWAVNVAGVAATVRAAAGVIEDGGRIITVSSTVGTRVPFPGLADYAAGKAALVAYTQGWARDFASKKVTVNAVKPGLIDTDMNPDNGAFADYVKGHLALGRYGKPEEVAAAILFLASPDASFITGATLVVDGGESA